MPAQTQSENTDVSWAVVGGGMLGMAVASRLKQVGRRVILLDAAQQLGGLTSAWKIGDVIWDKFYHVTLLSDKYLRQLLKELNLDDEIDWVQTRTGFYSKGKLHSLSSSIDFLKFPVLNLYQKFRLGSTIFCASKRSDWRALEQVSVESWLRKWSGNSTFESIWLPLLKCKLGDAYQRTNAAFIWAYIQRMYAARRSGMKREMFGIVNGGYHRVLSEYQRNLQERGVEIIPNAKVTRVKAVKSPRFSDDLLPDSSSRKSFLVDGDSPNRESQGGHAPDEKLVYGAQCSLSSSGPIEVEYVENSVIRKLSVDRVVMTVPSPQVLAITNDLSDDERRRLSRTEYLGVVCTSLLLTKPLGGYYVTNITDPGIPLTGVIEMGTILPPEKLGGHYLVYLPQYMLADDSRFDEPDESIHERCLATLERMYPNFQRSQVTRIQTARARYVMAIPTLNYSDERAAIKLQQPGLYVLNSARIVDGTLNVNEILRLVDQEISILR